VETEADRKMKTPRFTDSHRYPRGYVKSNATDISKTFARVKAEKKQIDEERKEKLRSIQIMRRA